MVDREKADVRGFMLRDARFFFLLFRNWLEHDLREPDTDIDLTQLKRACARLAARRHLVVVPPGKRRRSRRPRTRYVLTLAGVLGLVDELVAWTSARSFDEELFVVLFASSYRALVMRRAEQAGAPVARRARAIHVSSSRICAARSRSRSPTSKTGWPVEISSMQRPRRCAPPEPPTSRSSASSSASRRTSSTTCVH